MAVAEANEPCRAVNVELSGVAEVRERHGAGAAEVRWRSRPGAVSMEL